MASIVFALLITCSAPLGEVYQDFQSGSPLHPGLRLFGPGVNEVVRRDRHGLRITLPRNRDDTAAVGIEPQFVISGDFEITLDYEILSADKPESGMGPGVKIWAKTASEKFQALTLAHVVPLEGASRVVPILAKMEDGEKVFLRQPRTTSARSGRLRVTRTGSEVSYLFAEGESETFEELQRETSGTGDLAVVRVSAGTANDPCGVSVRFRSLRVRAQGLPAASVPEKGMRPNRIWLIVGLVAVVLSSAGVWYWRKRRRA